MSNNFVKTIEEQADSYGSIPFWSWNDKLDPEELRRQIRKMHELKMKGFFMHARGGLETPYLGDDWYKCIAACAGEAADLGMEAWLYDENGWPSGFAGGALLKDPVNYAAYIEFEKTESPDPGAMCIYIQDGDSVRLYSEGDKASEYYCVSKKYCDTYVDTMDKKVTAKFIAATHQEYKKRFGDCLGGVMPGFFTDEPQYYRWATPWSDTLPEEFMKAYGYDVKSGLAALFMDYKGAEEFRYDYYGLCHKLFMEHFAKPVYQWAEENGCKITGHTIEESFLAGQMWCTGGVMAFYQYEHIPGIDHLCRGIGNDLSPKQVASAAAQLGKKRVLSETFAACGWDVTPLELKNIAQWQYASGINLMCQHLYPYSIRGQRKTDYPAFYSEHLPWQEAMKDFNEYFNRLGAALAQGEERTQVLVIHPVHSCWMSYKRNDDSSVGELQDSLNRLLADLSDHQVLYHMGDETIMKNCGSVEEGKLRIGQCTYDTVVLPLLYTLDSSTAELLKKFIASGGKICAYDKLPGCIDGRVTDMSWLKADMKSEDLWQLSGISVKLSDGSKADNIRIRVMDRENGSTYYLVNLAMENRKGVQIDLNTDSPVKVYDPETGRDIFEYDNGRFTVDFAPAQGYVFYTEEAGDRPENAMTLDFASVAYGDNEFSRVMPVAQIRDLTLKKRYEGQLTMRFDFTVKELPGTAVRMACEPMKYSNVKVNGRTVELTDQWWLDRSFLTADVTSMLKTGGNKIELTFSYYQRPEVYDVIFGNAMESMRNCLSFDTEIENIYLYGDFGVLTEQDKFRPGNNGSIVYSGSFEMASAPERIAGEAMKNVVICGYPFLAGKIETETVFDLPVNQCVAGDVKLRLEGRFAYADVYVNNSYVSRFMFEYEKDISSYVKPGENKVTVVMCNSARNLLGPHHHVEQEPFAVGPDKFTGEKCWSQAGCSSFVDEYSFMPFGATVYITVGGTERQV